MFTGIIETLGEVKEIRKEGGNIHFCFASGVSPALKVDQSVSHNGVCLTVIKIGDGNHWITAVEETLKKSNLSALAVGDQVNIERSMVANGRFDGHIVQGHVDTVGTVESIKELDGSWQFDFIYDSEIGEITVEKGSIGVNGVSLTCFNCSKGRFSVAIIPYTYRHTNFGNLKTGDKVNLEFDIIGKYVRRLMGG